MDFEPIMIWFGRKPVWFSHCHQTEIAQLIQEYFDYWFINVKELVDKYYAITVEWWLDVWDKAVIYADDIAIGWWKINEKTFIS